MNKYLPLAIERYQHNYDPDFSVEDEYEKRLTSPASVVTKLFPLLTYPKRGRQIPKKCKAALSITASSGYLTS